MSAALLLLLACTDGGKGDVSLDGLTADQSEAIATVFTASWTSDVDTPSWLEATLADGRVVTTPADAGGTDHQAVLVGLPASTDFELRAVAAGGESEPLALTSGNLPQTMPQLSGGGEGNDQYAFIPAIGSSTAALILSPQGEIVWYHTESRELDVYRVRPSVDGTGVWYSAASVSGDPAADSELVHVSWDGSQIDTVPIPLLAHDFVEHPDGTLATIVVEYRDHGGEELRGDKLVEVAPDGTQTTIWSAWDCFDPDTAPGDEPVLGWTFANALDLSPDGTEYHLGIRNFSSILRIDRATGACLEVIGGFAADAPGDADVIRVDDDEFEHQHQFELVGDRLLVFDNEGLGGQQSRAVEYHLDRDAGTAEPVWEYAPDGLYSFVLGDVKRMDDGDTLITWSVAGEIDRVTADGTAEWTVNTSLGSAFGFATWTPSPYTLP
ncbi:MAG: aryl-sulfate sulfotransferase [Alphaproteobacteria bacterium]|nr:aryl-sulfate sulfotransferase [Alphaproteobacteria bacterium]